MDLSYVCSSLSCGVTDRVCDLEDPGFRGVQIYSSHIRSDIVVTYFYVVIILGRHTIQYNKSCTSVYRDFVHTSENRSRINDDPIFHTLEFQF